MKLATLYRAVVDIVRRTDRAPAARYLLASTIAAKIDPHYRFSEFGRSWLDDQPFIESHLAFPGNNPRNLDRHFTLKGLLALIARVPGDTAECGVYRGSSSRLICEATTGSGRQHHAFDSFAGLGAPQEVDGDYWRQGNMACSLAEVQRNLAAFVDCIAYHPGWIPERFDEVADRPFAFVHLDVDLYQPTLDSLVFFYPRLATGGVVVCDDYGFTSCPGARQAMDEFFAERSENIVHLPTGQGFIVKGS